MFRGVLPMILGRAGAEIPQDVAAEATTSTKEAREKILKELPFSNKQDFDFAARGFIATLDDPKIKDDNGKVVFDLASYDFLKGDAPETREPEPVAAGAAPHQARALQGRRAHLSGARVRRVDRVVHRRPTRAISSSIR